MHILIYSFSIVLKMYEKIAQNHSPKSCQNPRQNPRQNPARIPARIPPESAPESRQNPRQNPARIRARIPPESAPKSRQNFAPKFYMHFYNEFERFRSAASAPRGCLLNFLARFWRTVNSVIWHSVNGVILGGL
jgi:hypothetical protein